jgi:hypothetical protein
MRLMLCLQIQKFALRQDGRAQEETRIGERKRHLVAIELAVADRI